MTRANRSSAITWFILFFSITLITGCIREEIKPAQVGDKAPPFSFRDINNNEVTLSEWAGQPVIIRFWETDCPFCKADTPVFVDFYNRYREKGLKIIYVGSHFENINDIRSFVQQFHLDFHVMMDPVGQLARMFRIRQYPNTLILNPDHIITASLPGGVGRAELDELVGIYFQE